MLDVRTLRALFAAAIATTSTACGRGLPAVATPVRPATGPVVVVANQDHGVATIVDLVEWRLVAHVDVGMNPHEGAVSPDGRTVALASPSTWMGDARKISLVDVTSASLVRSIDLGTFRWPHGIAFLDPRTLVVSSRARSGIVFVDAESGAQTASAEAPGSQPYLLHVAQATGRIYTSTPHTNAVSEYDLARRIFIRDIPLAGQPSGFGVSSDGRTLWVSTGSHDTGGTIVVVDAQSGTTRARFPIPGYARRLAFSGNGARAVATNVVGHTLHVFETTELREAGRVALSDDTAPSGVACDPVSPMCYVSTIQSGELIEVDTAALRVVRRIDVGSGADGVVLVKR